MDLFAFMAHFIEALGIESAYGLSFGMQHYDLKRFRRMRTLHRLVF